MRQRLDRIVDSGAAYVTVRVNPAVIGFPVDAVMNIKVLGRNVREVGEQIAALERTSPTSAT